MLEFVGLWVRKQNGLKRRYWKRMLQNQNNLFWIKNIFWNKFCLVTNHGNVFVNLFHMLMYINLKMHDTLCQNALTPKLSFLDNAFLFWNHARIYQTIGIWHPMPQDVGVTLQKKDSPKSTWSCLGSEFMSEEVWKFSQKPKNLKRHYWKRMLQNQTNLFWVVNFF